MNRKKKLSLATTIAMVGLAATLMTSEKTQAFELMSFNYADQEDLEDVTYYISEEHFEEGSQEIEWVVEGVEAWNVAPEVNISRVDNRYDADVIITTSEDRPVFTNGQLLYGIANREMVILYESLIEDEETYVSTVTHEFGHSLGLHHTDAEGSVMLAFIEPGVEITDDDLEGITAIYERQEEYYEMIENEEVYMTDVFMDYKPVFEPHENFMDYQHIQYTMNPVFKGISINPFDHLMYDSYNMGIPVEDVYFEVEQIFIGETGEEIPFEVTSTEDGAEIYGFLIDSYEDFNDLVLVGGEHEGEEEFLAELEKEESDALYVKQQTSTLTLIDQLYSHLELENPEEIGADEDRPDVSIRDYDPAIDEGSRNLESYREIFQSQFTQEYEGDLELLGSVEGIDHVESFYNVDVTLKGYDVYKFTDESERFMSSVDENNEVMMVLFDLAVQNGEEFNLFDYDVVTINFGDPYSTAFGASRYLPDDLHFEELVGQTEYRFIPGLTEFTALAVLNAEQKAYFEEYGGHIFLNQSYQFDGDSSVKVGDSTPVDLVLDTSEITEDEFFVDVITAEQMAEKELIEEFSPTAMLETEAVDVSVSGVEITSLTPRPGYESEFGEGDAAITLELTYNNKSNDAIITGDLFNQLMVDGESFQAHSPFSYVKLVNPGEEGVGYMTYIVPEDVATNYSEMVFNITSLSDVNMNNLINYDTPNKELNLIQ